MNRLTEIINDVAYSKFKDSEYKHSPCWDCDFNNSEYSECEQTNCSYSAVLDKLAAYEDTGFEPEQVKQLNDAFTNSQKKLEKAFDDLLEYKKLEEQGLLIKLPCKVGDSIYFITQEVDIVRGSCRKVIDEYIVTEIRGNKYNPLWYMSSSERCVHRDFHPTAIGKTVFLTREEAERALEVRNE